MVILQRWEPTISKSFPSEIPFWIQIQGLLPHLWTEEILRSIGEDIGQFKSLDITNTMARMRVHINGLQPLIKKAIVEFKNGDEVEADLIYEKLEKHCNYCLNLDHEEKDCPSMYPNRSKDKRINSSRGKSPLQDKNRITRDDEYRKFSQPADYRSRPTKDKQHGHGEVDHDNRRPSHTYRPQSQGSHREYKDYRSSLSSRSQQTPSGVSSSHHNRSQSGRGYSTHSGPEYHHYNGGAKKSYHSSSIQNPPRLEYRRVSPPRHLPQSQKEHNHLRDSSSHLREPTPPIQSRRTSTETHLSHLTLPPPVPQAAMEVAMGELRDVMIQYASCADPSESAARKERLRLAEEKGEFEETAEQMVRASMPQTPPLENQVDPSVDISSQDRIPIALRLGPTNPVGLPPKPTKRKPVKAKKGPGRPPKGSKTHPSPRALPPGNSKKRKLLQKPQTPKRRLDMEAIATTSNQTRSAQAGESSRLNRPQDNILEERDHQAAGLTDFRSPSESLP